MRRKLLLFTRMVEKNSQNKNSLCSNCKTTFGDNESLNIHILTCIPSKSRRTPINKTFHDGTKWEPPTSTKTKLKSSKSSRYKQAEAVGAIGASAMLSPNTRQPETQPQEEQKLPCQFCHLLCDDMEIE